eukprot:GHVR01178810.1.p1 GENE.GHVR01178810.1~~GHVR01178810.1.p1  ORF type:complete len:381 (-),score=96.32 GHVR01178810.1:305-1447(-)
MLPLMLDVYGNPHSRSHAYGWEAEEFVENSRKEVADLVGARAKEIVFTSGATEANNLAIKGVAQYELQQNKKGKKRRHIITTQLEHKCVLASCRSLQDNGFYVTYLPVDKYGIVDIKSLEESVTEETLIVSVILVNNEIGTIQPMKDIAKICEKRGVLLHTDAAQAIGKLPFDVEELGVHMASFSSHKLYGPKGVGGLYVRSKKKRVRLIAQMDGGGQERGMRSGTLPAHLIVGFGAACRIAKEEIERDAKRVARLSDKLVTGIQSQVPHVTLNGPKEHTHRYAGIVNMSFAFVEGESLMMAANAIAISSGSACTSASLEPSYVLRALGVDEGLAHTSLRFGIGRFTTDSEIDLCVCVLNKQVGRLRDISPTWDDYININ